MIVRRKKVELRLHPTICCWKSAVNWREIFTLPELGDAAIAGSASLILYKDPASFISVTPPCGRLCRWSSPLLCSGKADCAVQKPLMMWKQQRNKQIHLWSISPVITSFTIHLRGGHSQLNTRLLEAGPVRFPRRGRPLVPLAGAAAYFCSMWRFWSKRLWIYSAPSIPKSVFSFCLYFYSCCPWQPGVWSGRTGVRISLTLTLSHTQMLSRPLFLSCLIGTISVYMSRIT